MAQWHEVRPARVAAGVVWGSLLVAAAVLVWPHAQHAWRLARMTAADPPGPMVVPVRDVGLGEFADTWGAARGGGRSHQGTDIFARRNTPVLSATQGVVVRVGENALGGRTVTVMGPGGWRHYYAHLEKWAGREEGEWVMPGDVIGFVGTTGNAPRQAPHLHYGIYTRQGAVNPFPFLVAAADTAAADTAATGRGR